MARSKTEELLHDFQLLTHMNIALYDSQFRCVCNMAEHAPYCAAVHRAKVCLDRCIRSDKQALESAKQTRSPQVYLCPYGLWEAIVPILEGDQILGYLFAGPAIPPEAASDLSSLFAKAKNDAPELSAEGLMEGAKQVCSPNTEELEVFLRLLSLLAEHIAANRLVSSDRQTLGYLIAQYVRKNLSAKITLSDISRRLHCSTVTLTETFRREYGMTIMQYVQEERMRLASRLLDDTDLSITAAAERCGFPDVEYFSRCFKQKYGLSPSAWRKH